jgi:chromosome segregation ATPase
MTLMTKSGTATLPVAEETSAPVHNPWPIDPAKFEAVEASLGKFATIAKNIVDLFDASSAAGGLMQAVAEAQDRRDRLQAESDALAAQIEAARAEVGELLGKKKTLDLEVADASREINRLRIQHAALAPQLRESQAIADLLPGRQQVLADVEAKLTELRRKVG